MMTIDSVTIEKDYRVTKAPGFSCESRRGIYFNKASAKTIPMPCRISFVEDEGRWFLVIDEKGFQIFSYRGNFIIRCAPLVRKLESLFDIKNPSFQIIESENNRFEIKLIQQ